MEQKKISFGFSKFSKKTNIISNHVKTDDKKVELIECLEGQSIKVKDAVEEVNQPLVIPIKDNQKNLLDRIREAKKRDRPQDQKNTEPADNRPDSELTVDELAARQLIRDAQLRLTQGNNINESKVSVLPLNQQTLSLEGEKEPTLEDYESVPIGDYGLALLRGMGWKEGMTVGRNTSKTVSVSAPELRPKGLGLGATKVIQSEIPTKKAVDKDGKELLLVKGAYVKLIAGVKKGNYCEVQGFDEEAGRVIVKAYPKGDILNVNEFMLIPVTKEEFSKGSKILNNAKYEEYLEISEKKLEKYKIKQESLKTEKNEEFESNDKMESRPSDGRSRDKYKSESSDSEYETEKKSRNHTKSKYRDRSRSRSPSRHKSKKDKDRRHSDYSSDSEYEKEKKEKHSKSKYRDRNQDRSKTKEKHKKDKKHKSKSRRDSSSESDSRRDKRKKNKCKSRHRRNSSSSSTDRKSYRSKK